ncbi:LCLAT1 [Symbiodinium natans]|uniref:LCLAT1 protein n=1 Tax=Symbiodinium natans TaxID=878477 RepID=A0A812NXV4_9DINO|nr:LCLAT1 [Symbiodinium natans]
MSQELTAALEAFDEPNGSCTPSVQPAKGRVRKAARKAKEAYEAKQAAEDAKADKKKSLAEAKKAAEQATREAMKAADLAVLFLTTATPGKCEAIAFGRTVLGASLCPMLRESVTRIWACMERPRYEPGRRADAPNSKKGTVAVVSDVNSYMLHCLTARVAFAASAKSDCPGTFLRHRILVPGRVVRPGSVLPSVCLTNTHPHPCVSGPNGFNMRDPTVRLVVFVAMTASGDGELDTWAAQGDLLLISNHPTRLDWMFLWALASALGRLSGLKIVLKDNLRAAPGFGWAVQCFAYPFMCRRDREADLNVLRSVCAQSGGRGKLALLLFPEGTDLSKSNLEKSQSYAQKEGLQIYTQVLHPRTAGFVAAWEALQDAAKELQSKPPVLVDVTMAYVAPVSANLPDEVAVFARGHIPHEVHIRLRRVAPSTSSSSSASELCCHLFAEKEDLLNRFHAPSGEGASTSNAGFGKPDTGVFASESSVLLEEVGGVKMRLFLSLLAVISLEAWGFALLQMMGWLWSLVSLIVACACFVVLGKITGGIDKVILQHAQQHPSSQHDLGKAR